MDSWECGTSNAGARSPHHAMQIHRVREERPSQRAHEFGGDDLGRIFMRNVMAPFNDLTLASSRKKSSLTHPHQFHPQLWVLRQ